MGGTKDVVAKDSKASVDVVSKAEDNNDIVPESVSSRYMEVVWAKQKGYPFWPAIIYAPENLADVLRDIATKKILTHHVVYYYGTGDFSAIPFKDCVKWSEAPESFKDGITENKAKKLKKPSSKMLASLKHAIKLATEELKLPKNDRVEWNHHNTKRPASSSNTSDSEEYESPPPQKKAKKKVAAALPAAEKPAEKNPPKKKKSLSSKVKKAAERLNSSETEDSRKLEIMKVLSTIKIQVDILISSGLPQAVNELRKHKNEAIAVAAKALRRYLKELAGVAPKSKVTTPNAAATTTSAPPSVNATSSKVPATKTSVPVLKDSATNAAAVPSPTTKENPVSKMSLTEESVQKQNEVVDRAALKDNVKQVLRKSPTVKKAAALEPSREMARVLLRDTFKKEDIVSSIESAVYQRYKKTSQEYWRQCRAITFGLNHVKVDQVNDGKLSAIDLAYSHPASIYS